LKSSLPKTLLLLGAVLVSAGIVAAAGLRNPATRVLNMPAASIFFSTAFIDEATKYTTDNDGGLTESVDSKNDKAKTEDYRGYTWAQAYYINKVVGTSSEIAPHAAAGLPPPVCRSGRTSSGET
jgi:hypothetical protein